MCHDKNPSFPPSNIDIIRMVWLTHSYNVRLPHETYWLPGLSSLSGHTLSSFSLNIVTFTYEFVKSKSTLGQWSWSELELFPFISHNDNISIVLDAKKQNSKSNEAQVFIWDLDIVSDMNAAIGSISSKLMVMHCKDFAKFHGRLWEQIDNGYWIESSLVFPSGRVEF